MPRKPKGWSYSAGQRGRNRVRAFENRHGMLYLEYYDRAPEGLKPKRVSLGHRDRDRAKRQADRIAAEFGDGEPARLSNPTLQQLFDKYLAEVTSGKGASKQKHDRRAAGMFAKFFGPARKASTLNVRDWNEFIRLRRSGALATEHGNGEPVGNRTIEYDLKFLLSVLNWATKVRVGGEPLLASNPLRGLPLPKEKNPRRPMFTDDEYATLCRVAPRIDWRFALALVLAHETGHRIGAIRKLRWSDVNLETGMVTWRAASDKTGREHETPLNDAAMAALSAARRVHPVIGDAWLFPATRNASTPCSIRTMQQWMADALDAGGVKQRRGLGWHSLRRKFATELDGVPLKVLMTLGGWRDHRTILQCYQQPDVAAMRDALQTRSQSTHQSTHRVADASGP